MSNALYDKTTAEILARRRVPIKEARALAKIIVDLNCVEYDERGKLLICEHEKLGVLMPELLEAVASSRLESADAAVHQEKLDNYNSLDARMERKKKLQDFMETLPKGNTDDVKIYRAKKMDEYLAANPDPNRSW